MILFSPSYLRLPYGPGFIVLTASIILALIKALDAKMHWGVIIVLKPKE
jgi:hypothetical protein